MNDGVGLRPFAARLPPQHCIAERAMKKSTNNQTAASTGKPHGSKKRPVVLHVDDDPNDTTLLQVACAKAAVDFEVQNIGDSTEVMDYLRGTGKYADRSRYQFPGLVLLDMKMPQATGLDILKWIRSHPISERLPVIVLSGSDLQEDRHRAFEIGANSYLVKPPNFDSLVNMVKDIGLQLGRA
jgi:DNA-binding response OmpR family regulator